MADLKFGRRPPTQGPALMLAPLLTGVVPAHPAFADNLARLSAWQMLGNDAYGDCVAVTWANTRRLVTAVLATEHYPSQADVFAVYKTQNPGFIADPSNPGEDNGMDIQTLLDYLVKVGGPDGVKALAFAKVDPHNRDEMDAAIAIFGSVWTGIQVLEANMNEFNSGQPWDYVPGSPVAGGHSIITGAYSGKPGADLGFITWAQQTSFTDLYIAHEFEEAWVVIWPEHLGSKAFLDGIDQTALAADYEALTGRPFPVPTPAPTPGPQPGPTPGPGPTPTPASADATLANATRVWAAARHSGTNRVAANAIRAWLKAKGL
jgi:hypothetical protein